jgi:hypothetical protein
MNKYVAQFAHKLSTSSSAKTMILALLGASLGACSSGPTGSTVVQANVAGAGTPFGVLGAGNLQSVNGTYGDGCTARSGAWSIIVSGTDSDNSILSVVKDDTGCVLTLTEIHSDTGVFAAQPVIPMTGSYQAASSQFVLESDAASPVSFYANALITPTGFDTDFAVDILYSTDPSSGGDAGVQAGYTVTSGSVSADAVPTPNDSVDVTGLSLETNAVNVVQSVSGSAAVTTGSIPGQTYVIELGALPSSPAYADVDTAFQEATGDAGASTLGATFSASEFGLVGIDLSSPVVRTIIIANTQSGVPSYEFFTIVFTHPSS